MAVAALAVVVGVSFAAPAWAAAPGVAPGTAPHTGLEGGQRHTFGPDGEGKRDPRLATTPSYTDAYGNPVVPQEETDTVRERPRPGAYGTRGTPPSRPLPDAPGNDAGWKFR